MAISARLGHWPRRTTYWRGRCTDAERRLVETKILLNNATKTLASYEQTTFSAISSLERGDVDDALTILRDAVRQNAR